MCSMKNVQLEARKHTDHRMKRRGSQSDRGFHCCSWIRTISYFSPCGSRAESVLVVLHHLGDLSQDAMVTFNSYKFMVSNVLFGYLRCTDVFCLSCLYAHDISLTRLESVNVDVMWSRAQTPIMFQCTWLFTNLSHSPFVSDGRLRHPRPHHGAALAATGGHRWKTKTVLETETVETPTNTDD